MGSINNLAQLNQQVVDRPPSLSRLAEFGSMKTRDQPAVLQAVSTLFICLKQSLGRQGTYPTRAVSIDHEPNPNSLPPGVERIIKMGRGGKANNNTDNTIYCGFVAVACYAFDYSQLGGKNAKGSFRDHILRVLNRHNFKFEALVNGSPVIMNMFNERKETTQTKVQTKVSQKLRDTSEALDVSVFRRDDPLTQIRRADAPRLNILVTVALEIDPSSAHEALVVRDEFSGSGRLENNPDIAHEQPAQKKQKRDDPPGAYFR